LTITGSGFQNDTKVSLKIHGETVEAKKTVSVTPSTQIEVVFDLPKRVRPVAGQTMKGQVIVTNPGVQPGDEKDLSIHYETGPGKGSATKPNVPA
jgi:hypothetical protein